MTRSPSVRYFEEAAAVLANRYDTLGFSDIHSGVAPFLPASGAKVADIGAGSGRDALALADMGYRVIAVEPSSSLRAVAEAKDPAGRVTWVADSLPDLAGLGAQDATFDLIICSAVIMFLNANHVAASLRRLAALLRPHGHLWLTFRTMRSPDDPVFFCHMPASIDAAASRSGLVRANQKASADLLGRQLEWIAFAYEKRDVSQ